MRKIRPGRTAVFLEDCVRQDADPLKIAAALAATLQDIELSLSSVIGARGVAALYRRALLLATTSHPWLAAAPSDPGAAATQTTLQSVVFLQTSDVAATGAHAILHNFQSLLQALVGSPLTHRLLQSVLTNFSQSASAQDDPP